MRFSLFFGLVALGGQLGVNARALSDQYNHIDDVTVDRRAGAGPPGGVPRPPPKPPTTNPGRTGTGVTLPPRVAKLADSWEIRSSQDVSDLIQVTGCNAKRDLSVDPSSTKALSKRAPNDLTWDEWQRVYAAVERAIDPAVGTIKIYVAGGISAVALGAREGTADSDYVIEGGPYPDQAKVAALEKAIDAAMDDPQIADIAGKLSFDYMNDDIATDVLSEIGKAYVDSDASSEKAYPGTGKLVVVHMAYDLQLMMKVTRITLMSGKQGYKPYDVTDAKAFLPKAAAMHDGQLSLSDVQTLGDRIGMQESESQSAFSTSIKLVDPDLATFSDNVKNWVKDAGC